VIRAAIAGCLFLLMDCVEGAMRWCLTVLFVAAGCLAATQASADRRVALVVGNSQYEHTQALPNPRNDAEDIARTLEKLGFEVKVGYDLDQIKFARLIDDFARALDGADVGLFFYAGHGLQINDRNYLVSTQAKLESTFLVPSETIELDAVIRLMESKAGTNVVFLDACRNNPLADNLKRNLAAANRAASVGRGLAPVAQTGHDTLVVYSAAPGETAADGTGRNSPFAASLLQHLPEPGLEISVMLKDVTADVRRETDNKQRPQQLSDMSKKFYFVKTEAPAVFPPPAGPAAPQSPDSLELAYWQSASAANECESIRAYIRRYPNGSFKDLALIAERRLCKAGPEAAVASPQTPTPAPTPPPAAPPTGPAADASAPRGWLGVRIQQVTDDIAESLNIKPSRGALVAGVDDKGPSKPAGIEAGDVIVRFGGHDIKEVKDLPRIVADTPVGKEVEVVVIRKGNEVTRTVKLGRLEDAPKQAALPAGKDAPPPANNAPPPEMTAEQKILGLNLANMTDEVRKRYKIKDSVKGAVITGVDAASPAADKRLNAGDVVVEVQQEPVADAAALQTKIDRFKADGRLRVLLLISNPDGDLRFIVLSLVAAAPIAEPPAQRVDPPPPPARHPEAGRQSGGRGRR
jgi:uncharacterized caspase-like protein